ncbi:MAG: FecR domain-containing protein [Thermodesulfobacteriota bacterium]
MILNQTVLTRMSPLALAVSILCLMFGPCWGAAETISVTVQKVSGPVQAVQPDGRSIPLRVGDRLTPGQTIEAGSGGRAVLKLADGSTLEVYEDARLEINESLAREESSFSLALGYIRLKLQRLLAPEMVVTPTMIAGVRGTEFGVNVAADGASVVSVTEGEVSVSTDQDDENEREIMLRAGQEVEAEEHGRALTPRSVQIRSFEDAKAFRQARLEKLAGNLPQIAEKMQKMIGPSLERLDRTKTMFQNKAKRVKFMAERLEKMDRQERAKQRALMSELKKELENIQRVGKALRGQIMRLKTLSGRAAHLKKILPSLKDKLGAGYDQVDQGLGSIVSRGPEIKSKVQAAIQETRQAAEPIKPVFMKFKQMSGDAPSRPEPRPQSPVKPRGKPGQAG